MRGRLDTYVLAIVGANCPGHAARGTAGNAVEESLHYFLLRFTPVIIAPVVVSKFFIGLDALALLLEGHS